MSKDFVLLILSALCAVTASGSGFYQAVYADDEQAVDKMFGQFEGQDFRNSFFSQQARFGQPGDDAEAYAALKKRRQEKLEKRQAEEIIEEKDKVERQARLNSIFDRDESGVLDQLYVTPTFESSFEKKVLPPDLFSVDRRTSPFQFANLDQGDDDSDKNDDLSDWKKVRRSNPGLFPRPRELDERDDRNRRDLAKLAGPVREVTGDWVPSKLDPNSNGGFTISPDNGSPVPYKLNGHVDIQRGRPWNDND